MKSEEILDSLKLEPKGFPETWDVGCERKARAEDDCKAAQTSGDQGRPPLLPPLLGLLFPEFWGTPTLLCLSPPSLSIPSRLLGSLTSWLWPPITEISKDPFPGPLLSEASLHPGDLIRSSHALPQAADSPSLHRALLSPELQTHKL